MRIKLEPSSCSAGAPQTFLPTNPLKTVSQFFNLVHCHGQQIAYRYKILELYFLISRNSYEAFVALAASGGKVDKRPNCILGGELIYPTQPAWWQILVFKGPPCILFSAMYRIKCDIDQNQSACTSHSALPLFPSCKRIIHAEIKKPNNSHFIE
jgi:hypothetical protein